MSGTANKLTEISDAIRRRRKALGLSQQDVADLIGVQRQTIGRLENSDPSVAVGTAVRVIEVLGLSALGNNSGES